MNNGAKVVADAILGEDLKFVTIGKEVYSIKPPCIEVILKAIRHLAKVKLDGENYTKVTILSQYEKNTEHITRALAVLITGDDNRNTKKVAEKLKKGTYKELLVAYNAAIHMMGGDDFFALAQLAKNLQNVAARPK